MGEAPNAIHDLSPPDASWSSINLAEAVPGVMTPLCWSLWGTPAEKGIREPFYAMGALTRRESAIPADPDERAVKIFFGRQAVRVDFVCRAGDLIPGQSGKGVARDVFGFVPPDFVSTPSLRRLPVIALRYPATLARIASRARTLRRETSAWWRAEIERGPRLDLTQARAQFHRAADQFTVTLGAQATVIACALQPIYEQVATLAAAVDVDAGGLMKGHGSHEETAAIDDLWRVSRAALSEPEFLARHGYHGPAEGELSSVVWREDPEPVRRLVANYRGLSDDADPVRAEAARASERAAAERAFLARLSARQRPLARILLRLAGRYMPLRGVLKVSYLQSIDVARAAARRAGTLLARDGSLAEGEDVFYLTADELLGEPPAEARALVEQRRALRRRYQDLEVPSSFTGQPRAVDAPARPADGDECLTGLGASSGTIEGRAVVVSNPAEDEIEPGDVLVAHTTDPAWASIMFLSAGLVVDIGGMLSHAAVIAREIGVPCVMNTVTGTRVLRTGDRVRVDGAAGTVEIVQRATVPTAEG